MTKIFWGCFLLINLLAYKTFAYTPSEGKVTALFGPYIYQTKFNGANGFDAPNLTDLGLIAEGDLNSSGGLEIALFHMNKIFYRHKEGQYIAEQTELVEITMGYRRWWTNYFSSALAFYSSYSIGVPKIIRSDFAVGSEIDTSARDITEYGFDFSLQAELWSNETYAVILDTRYGLSVTSKQNEEGDHWSALVGLRYTIQEKLRPKTYKSPNLKR
ncbi:MAG: hypothetical protein H7061_08885 [Bdellovibrionaceae bacterium]|nr:hypothetical protein [Bdellovibrio sp.]